MAAIRILELYTIVIALSLPSGAAAAPMQSRMLAVRRRETGTPRYMLDTDQSWYAMASNADGTVLVTGSSSGQLWKSTDSGDNWAELTFGDGQPLGFLSDATVSEDGQRIVVVQSTADGPIRVSADGGETWSWYRPRTSTEDAQGYRSVDSSSDGRRVVVSSKDHIWTSDNGGDDWVVARSISSSADNAQWRVVRSSNDGNTIIAMEWLGSIWVSHDAGSSWMERTPTFQGKWYSAAMSADGSVLVASRLPDSPGEEVGQYMRWISNDRGDTWTSTATPANGPLKVFDITCNVDCGRLALAENGGLTSEGSVWTSDDKGATWTKHQNGNGDGHGNLLRRIASNAAGTQIAVAHNNGYSPTSGFVAIHSLPALSVPTPPPTSAPTSSDPTPSPTPPPTTFNPTPSPTPPPTTVNPTPSPTPPPTTVNPTLMPTPTPTTLIEPQCNVGPTGDRCRVLQAVKTLLHVLDYNDLEIVVEAAQQRQQNLDPAGRA